MIALTLALLAEAVTSTGSPRKALSDCLNQLIQPAADAKTKPDEFATQAKEKCTTQGDALEKFLIQDNRSTGMNANAATADAKEQVQDLLDRVKDKYLDWYDTNITKKGA